MPRIPALIHVDHVRLAVFAFVLASICCRSAPSGESELRAGETVLSERFDTADALSRWPSRLGAVSVVKDGGRSRAVLVSNQDPGRGARIARRVELRPYRGAKLLFSARIKAAGVSRKPQPWNGIKFMAALELTGGKRIWPQATVGVGSFDWKQVAWQTRIPRDAVAMDLVLGLEQVTGKVWFDDLTVKVRRPPRRIPLDVPSTPHRGHNLPRLRGAMVSPQATAADLRALGKEWNANVIRWQLCGFKPRFDTGDLARYDAFLEEHLKRLDAALPVCEETGLLVVVDLHTGPGHWAEHGRSLFTNAACQQRFVEIWEEIAKRYKNDRAVWAYDLLNEPLEEGTAEGLADWQELAERAARAIRRIDRERTILVEPAPWGSPPAIDNLEPLDVPNVAYSVHMYMPHRFTHQGVHDAEQEPVSYPGIVEGKRWDRAALEDALEPVFEFQRTYGTHIYLGEFSAIRWAPDGSAYRYLRDSIEIFERHRWDWSYHAFREWSGWSVEHGSDRRDTRPTSEPTARKKLLLEWFAKNKKPAWAQAGSQVNSQGER